MFCFNDSRFKLLELNYGIVVIFSQRKNMLMDDFYVDHVTRLIIYEIPRLKIVIYKDFTLKITSKS